MEKVRGRMRRIRHRFELPSCWRPKKEMPNLIYTVLDRDRDSLLLTQTHHYRRQAPVKDNRVGSLLRTEDRLSDVSSWDRDLDGPCEFKDGWNINFNPANRGPIIRVATFDVALFSLAPAIPPDHPCAAAAAAPPTTPATAAPQSDSQSFEPTTPSHFLSSESSSIFSYKSKSSSSDASSGMTSFSNSRESTDSMETCAILSQHASKPTQTFNVCLSQPPKSPPVFDISRVWRSSPSSRSYKPRTLSPFKPTGGKNNVGGNVYHSKLNPVFGMSNNSSSRCLMDSLPSLFSDFLCSDHPRSPFEQSLPLPCDDEDNEEKQVFSPEFSVCDSGFQTPLHPELLPSGASSPATSSQAASPQNSVCTFDSPCSNLSSVFNGSAEADSGSRRSSGASAACSILDILLEVDADIISLQEVRAEEERGMKPLSELAEALGMEYAYAESWAPEFGNAVLSRWPIKSASVQQLHDETDYRNVLKVVVEVPLAGDLHVYCTQLDHLDEDWRLKQVQSLMQMVPSSRPHILTGNLNSLERSDYSRERWEEIAQARKQSRKLPPRGDVLKKLVQEKGYLDAKLSVREEQLEAWMHLKGQGVDGTCQHGTRVDYILGSPKLPFDFVPGSYSVISSRGTSNHDLALVDLQPQCF